MLYRAGYGFKDPNQADAHETSKLRSLEFGLAWLKQTARPRGGRVDFNCAAPVRAGAGRGKTKKEWA